MEGLEVREVHPPGEGGVHLNVQVIQRRGLQEMLHVWSDGRRHRLVQKGL
jgi:autonomous glycyl radical cofactor GrcA